jgi:hypothetical protein
MERRNGRLRPTHLILQQSEIQLDSTIPGIVAERLSITSLRIGKPTGQPMHVAEIGKRAGMAGFHVQCTLKLDMRTLELAAGSQDAAQHTVNFSRSAAILDGRLQYSLCPGKIAFTKRPPRSFDEIRPSSIG